MTWLPTPGGPYTRVRPARAATPIAPAATLYLRSVQFMDFRKAGSDNVSDVNRPARLQRLVPSDRVQADIDAFQRAVLDPALAPALSSPEWDVFTGGGLRSPRLGRFASIRSTRLGCFANVVNHLT